MKIIKKFIFLMIIVFSISLISAQSVTLQLCTNAHCYNYDDSSNLQKIDSNDSLILKVGVVHQGSDFVCFNGLRYQFEIISNNINDYYAGQSNNKKGLSGYMTPQSQYSNSNFCLKKGELYNFYIPLRGESDNYNNWDYNSLTSSARLGSWAISNFELTFYNPEYHNDVSLKDNTMTRTNENSLVGNEIKFTVYTEEPNGNVPSPLSKSTVDNLKNWVFVAIVPLLMFLGAGLIDKDKRRKKIWICLFILLLVISVLLYFIL